MATVPDVSGVSRANAEATIKAAGLTIGPISISNSVSVPAGTVMSTNPIAGTTVNPGDAVILEVSDGPLPLRVPNVFGLVRKAAEAAITSAGFTVGPVTEIPSSIIPSGGVISQRPVGLSIAAPGSAVELEVSARNFDLMTWLFGALGVAILGVIVWGLSDKQGFLHTLADQRNARGLITFLIAITTVGIAVILCISTIVLKGGEEDKDRFDRGKQVLTTLIGVLGTIVGFYFGSPIDGQPPSSLAAFSCTQINLISGSNTPCTITLPINAPVGGTVITLTSTGGVTVPVNVSVAAGANFGTFTAQAGAVATPTAATITATLNGASKAVNLSVTPASLPPPPKP